MTTRHLAKGTFAVAAMTPTAWVPEITTALPTGHAEMVKTYEGEVTGRSITAFTGGFDPERGVGSYVALESFEGSIHGRAGTLTFLHAASTTGEDRNHEYGIVAPHSGTGELAGITGTVTIGTDHSITFDYTLD